MYEVAASMGVILAERYLATGKVPTRMGSASSLFAPYQANETADGYVTVGATGPPGAFRQFCEAIGAPELADRREYLDNARRVEHQAELTHEIEECTRTRTTNEWVAVVHRVRYAVEPDPRHRGASRSRTNAGVGANRRCRHSSLGTYETLRSP